MPEIGWRFEIERTSGTTTPLHPSTTGSYSFDLTRPISRAISGFILVPEEFDKVDLVRDKVNVYLVVDGVSCRMGVFRFSESTYVVDATKTFSATNNVVGGGDPYDSPDTYDSPDGYDDPGTRLREGYDSRDLHHISLADIMTDLIRNDGTAETLRTGFDASQEMRRILLADGLRFSVAGAPAPSRNDTTWDGSATDLDKVSQLAQLAGHYEPWCDNQGIVRSISTDLNNINPIDLDDLSPTAQSIAITDQFLSAPNRVIVNDNSATDRPIMGQWDAPSTAPHSYAALGYHRTSIQSVQGLGSNDHAQAVAQALGASYTARKLDCEIQPTCLLDGPVVISFRGALWVCTQWSTSTAPNSTMTLTAQEYKT